MRVVLRLKEITPIANSTHQRQALKPVAAPATMEKLGKLGISDPLAVALSTIRPVLKEPNAIRRGFGLLGSVLHPPLNPVSVPEVDGIATVVELDQTEEHYELVGGRMRPWHDVPRRLQVSRGYKV
jgi:hypothetical protein